MKKKIVITPLSKVAEMIFKIGLPAIALVFTYILKLLIEAPKNDSAWLLTTVPEMLEYAMMSYALIFCGALLADISLKYNK